MQPLKHLLGVFAVLGRWPDWESYFDLSRRGLRVALVVLALCLLPLWVVVMGVQDQRAQLLETAVSMPNPLSFGLIIGLWLFSFPALAYLIAMIFERTDRTRAWIITRCWSVFALCLVTGLAFGLYLLGIAPFMAANGIAFAAFLGLLAVDIRLLSKVAGFPLGIATLLGCVIMAVGLTFIQLSLSAG
jgi:hypothetical protein